MTIFSVLQALKREFVIFNSKQLGIRTNEQESVTNSINLLEFEFSDVFKNTWQRMITNLFSSRMQIKTSTSVIQPTSQGRTRNWPVSLYPLTTISSR